MGMAANGPGTIADYLRAWFRANARQLHEKLRLVAVLL